MNTKESIRFMYLCDEAFKHNSSKDVIDSLIEWESSDAKETTNEFIRDNCSHYLKDWPYLYTTNNIEELEFPLAFSIITFKNFNQVEQLLRTIYRPWNYYCIHVDKKSDEHLFNLISSMIYCLNSRFNNIVNVMNRFRVIWGTISVLEADLSCMKELYRRYKSWKYLINLTGQEFPLKTNWELVRILRLYNGSNNVEGTVRRRFNTRIPKSKLKFSVVWHYGSIHIAVNRYFVEFIVNDKKAFTILRHLKKTYIPDENYFATLNYNPHIFKIPGSYVGDPDDSFDNHGQRQYVLTRYKNWGQHNCFSRVRVRQICILGVGDLPNLVEATQLFANKFYYDFQPATLKCLEYYYREKVKREIRTNRLFINETFYKLQPFVLNQYKP